MWSDVIQKRSRVFPLLFYKNSIDVIMPTMADIMINKMLLIFFFVINFFAIYITPSTSRHMVLTMSKLIVKPAPIPTAFRTSKNPVDSIKPITIGFTPLRKAWKYGFLIMCFSMVATSKIIRNDGSTTPMVATMLPISPA